MFKFLFNAISKSLGFSKTESKGTLILIFIMFIALVISHYRVSILKNRAVIMTDSTDLEWIQQMQASYEIKESQNEFDKSVYFQVEYDKRKSTKSNTSPSSTKLSEKKSIKIRDLNFATAEELQVVKGIGKAFSKRIVKYRDMLGGFSDSTQLNEVYGLPNETILELFKSFSIQSPVQRLELNNDSINVLASHPYISYDLARVIINYRSEHGDIESIEDLRKIKALDERTFMRIKPYLE